MHGAETITMPLPHGRKALWFPEFNLVALAPGLDSAAREQALDDLQAEWRKSLQLTVVDSAA